MPISHTHKTIFVHIPKNAGSSVEKALNIYGESHVPDYEILYGIENFKALQHLSALEIQKRIDPSTFADYYKFCVIRNPFDRLVSEYHWRKDFPACALESSFEEFVNDYLVIKNKNSDLDKILEDHFHSQHQFITNETGNTLVDFVCRFENLDHDIKIAFNKIGTAIDLPHALKSDRSNYRNYYNATTRNIVENVYQKDFELFGYSF